MPLPHQFLTQRASDQTIGADDQNPARGYRPGWLRRALVAGSCASLCSTVLLSLLSHGRLRAPAAGTNATSHWIWPRSAHRHVQPDMPHTLVGYTVHHLCSVFWACGYELLRGRRHAPEAVLAVATTTTAVAYLVDYKVVPARLSPGFERHLRRSDLVWVYAAFAAGLALPALVAKRSRRTHRR
jgi:membrane-bound metal-dependent hydrolase YbcI (DUF457 family)